MDLKVQRDLFIGFFRSTMLGYGGGPSAIPLVHAEVVKRYRWMNDEEFSDVLALGNTLPGPIATKMAGYIGYRVGGTLGMINALVATVLPTVILMIVLIGFLAAFRDSKIVQGMTQAVSPVVGVMLATLAYDFFKQSKKNLGWTKACVLSLISVAAFVLLNIHPALIITFFMVYALLYKPSKEKKQDHQKSVSGGM
jgi:chromate transporter